MLRQKLRVHRDVTVVEVGDSHIENHIEEESEIQYGKIEPVLFRPDTILHTDINSENPERLDKQVQENQQTDVEYEIPLFQIFMTQKKII